MAVFSIIKLSELEEAKRTDAEYYKPEYLELLLRLRKAGCVPVKDVAFPIRRKFKPKKGEYFDYIEISKVDLTTGEFDTSKIIGEEAPDRAQWVVNKDDILISTVRPIRNAIVLIKEGKENLVCSSGFCVLHPKTIQANYLFLYFKMPFIARLLDMHTTATEYPAINWNDVLNTPVYVGCKEFQTKISLMVDKSFALLKQSRSLYSQAENLLLEELELKDFKPRYEKTYSTKLSDALSAHRIDAEYFQPAYEEVIEMLKARVKVEKLKNVASFIDHGKQPYYVENGDVPVLIQKHLGSKLLILYSEIVSMPDTPKTDRNFIEKYPEYLIRPFDILFYSVGAYLGRTNVVLENFEAVPASFITLIRTKQEVCNSVYLGLFLNSEIGQLQSSRWKSASAQQYIYPKEIKEFIIPILSMSTQQEIASLVQQSHEARRKAKELLEVAKKAIEIAIEKNEEEALLVIQTVQNYTYFVQPSPDQEEGLALFASPLLPNPL
jgi:type I restriction enzyme S subunit